MEINLCGDGFHLKLDVHGYEFEHVGGDPYDDNWLSRAVTLEVVQPRIASFKAKCDVSWQTSDPQRFQEALRTLLDDLTGVASFSTFEDQVELTIRLENGTGNGEGRVEAHAVASPEFEGTTDQSFLKQGMADLRQVNAAYPFRR
jgi:hypothetical protein